MRNLPEVIFSGTNSAESRRISMLRKQGLVVKLFPRVYTSNLQEEAAEIVKRNWQIIIANLFPGALLSHRSAIEFVPSPNNNIYITHNSRKVLRWPGLTVRMVQGHAPLEDDHPMYGQLHVASLERACLENLMKSRLVEGELRTLPQEKIEERLIQILNTEGEKGLNRFRDRAREIAELIDMEKAFARLNKIISSLLSTRPSKFLKSSAALAMAFGEPYDSGRLELFSILIAYLRQCTFEQRKSIYGPIAYKHMAFFESYFSNYIEGTTFVVEEAEEIIFKNKYIPNRTKDTHDVKGTYKVCGDFVEMQTLAKSDTDFLEILRARHAIILGGRPDKKPGVFKTEANRAGSSYFVKPEHVVGTLKQGYQLLAGLNDPLARAIFMMFLVSEVHPFVDGNGRIARLMMNAELVALGITKLIIPTVYREDYILNLKKLTKERDPIGFVKMMDRAHCFSHWLRPKNLDEVKEQLTSSNAFKESEEATLQFPDRSKSTLPR